MNHDPLCYRSFQTERAEDKSAAPFFQISVQNPELADRFSSLSTPLVADAALRLKLPCAFHRPELFPLSHRSGLPVRHFGSVDIFLEAMEAANAGDVLVIDNGGRTSGEQTEVLPITWRNVRSIRTIPFANTCAK